jgi:OFA family oxalate/formate antiporter-like MFS transporter
MGRGGEAKPLMESMSTSEEYGLTSKGPLTTTNTAGDDDPNERRPETTDETASQRQPTTNVWVTLGVALCVGLVAGSLYGFGRYSRDLRDTMGISQMTVQRFGILLDTGNYIGHPLTGWIYDRFGPRKSCLAAALIVFSSYGSIHLGLSSAPIWMMDLGFFGVGFGSGLGYIAGLGSTTNAFAATPHLGRAVGMVAAGYGFSSTVVGIVYYHTGLAEFFLLWGILFAVMLIVGAFTFAPKENREDEDRGAELSNPSAPRGLEPEASEELIEEEESSRSDIEAYHLLPETSDPLLPETSDSVASRDSVDSGRSTHEWNSWKRLDFWLLFGSFACITGCGLMIINNISTMVQSIGGADSLAGYLVVVLSMCNVFGRILMGSLADHPKLHKLDLYRYASLLMALALVISAIGGNSAVCLAMTVALAAIAYGGSWVLIIGILADFYGKDDFGKDYGLIAMGPAISGMIFNSLSAKLYESHADEVSGVCIGAVCYRDAFVMTAVSATAGYLILLWLVPARPHSRQEEDSVRYSDVIQDVIE